MKFHLGLFNIYVASGNANVEQAKFGSQTAFIFAGLCAKCVCDCVYVFRAGKITVRGAYALHAAEWKLSPGGESNNNTHMSDLEM